MKGNYSNLGTRLRHLIELLDNDVEKSYAEAGLDKYKPRYTPVFRALTHEQPLTIKQLTLRTKVSQPAVTQTINAMEKHQLIVRVKGDDARENQVQLSQQGLDMLPQLQAQWQATKKAAASLDNELDHSLLATVEMAITALNNNSFQQRIAFNKKEK